MAHYDVCIIGGGPSGYAAAIRALDLGKKTALIERNKIGGAGVFNGALSSKTMWELSDNYRVMQARNFGYTVKEYELNFQSVITEVRQATKEKSDQLVQQLKHYQKTGALEVIQGVGSLKSSKEVEVVTENNKLELSATTIILATGSRPRLLNHIPVDEKIILTSDGIHNLQEFPESIVILGAGVIGCEFATILSNFGKTKVFLIDKQPRILPFEDEDIASEVAMTLEKNGVVIHKESELSSMSIEGGKVKYKLKYADGREEEHWVEKALISVGRVPNYEDLGMDKIGIKLNNQNFCENDDCQTSIQNIYAVGDLTADIALVNIAELEGRHAIEKAYGLSNTPITYNNISTIMFLNPEVAAVGMNELQAVNAKIPYRMASIRYEYISRAIAKRQKAGFFKILVTDDEHMKILGIRAVGDHASSNIQAIALLIYMNKGIEELCAMVHAHPSMPEGLQECARMLVGTSIIKPTIFGKYLQCYRVDENGKKHEIEGLAYAL